MLNEFNNIEALKKNFNWGAFWLGWLWGLFNNSYITLIQLPIIFIPKVGSLLSLCLAIFFGIKGNTWALTNKKFRSSFAFIKYQKILAFIGFLLSSTLFILAMIVVTLSALHPSGYDFSIIRAEVQFLILILILIYIVTLPLLLVTICKKEQ